jgi:hypothetical protein
MAALTDVALGYALDARRQARRPVTVPWRAPLAGFVAGFLVAVLPAAIVTRLAASQLPMVAPLLHGGAALTFALVLACAAGLATAVCCAARAAHR